MVQIRWIAELLNRSDKKDSELSKYWEIEGLCTIQRTRLPSNGALVFPRTEYCIRR
jgi:hypothetical protein